MLFETLTDFVLLFSVGAPLMYLLFSDKIDYEISGIFIAGYTPIFIHTGIISALGTSEFPIGWVLVITILNILILQFYRRSKNQTIAYSLCVFTVLLLIPAFANTKVQYPLIFKGFSIALIVSLPFFLVFRYLDLPQKILGFLAVNSHFLDASSTYIALNNSLEESRALANLFIDIMGPQGIFFMKAFLIPPAIVFASFKVEKKHLRPLLFLVFGYGLILSVRNFLLISLSVS